MPVMKVGPGRALLYSGVETYDQKVLATGPIAYWPLWETAGVTAVNYGSLGAAANGTYVSIVPGTGIGPDGGPCPWFDGAADYVNIFTPAFDAAFNGATGTALLWFRAANVGVWTDAARGDTLMLFDDAGNFYRMTKAAANNRWEGSGVAGAGTVTITRNASAEIIWIPTAITWSDSANADEFKAFWAGAQVGATSAALNAWAGGGLTATATAIGAYGAGVINPFHGWIAHCAIWDRVLPQAEITDLANP